MAEYDNLCKYLAEKYPDRFASWLLGREVSGTTVFKTELSIEPIRADSVTFLRLEDRILHLEFQVNVPRNKPMPLRMLNYWVRLYWQHNLPITQVLIWLKETNSEAVKDLERKINCYDLLAARVLSTSYQNARLSSFLPRTARRYHSLSINYHLGVIALISLRPLPRWQSLTVSIALAFLYPLPQ